MSWLGLFLLLFNVAGGGAIPPPSAHAGATPLFAQELLSVDRTVICTAAGMVVLGRDGKPVDENRPHAPHDGFCVFCLPLMHAGAVAPVADSGAVLPPASSAPLVFADGYRRSVRPSVHNPNPARAPPASV
jgi:hypothetical protein